MKTQNQKIGTWECERGGAADVFQTVKRGRHFYTKCECCGLNQGTGAGRQQQIFDEAQFIDKTAVVIPSGVTAGGARVIESAPEPKKIESVSDFDPAQPLESEPKAVATSDRSMVRMMPGVLFLLAAGVGLWMS